MVSVTTPKVRKYKVTGDLCVHRHTCDLVVSFRSKSGQIRAVNLHCGEGSQFYKIFMRHLQNCYPMTLEVHKDKTHFMGVVMWFETYNYEVHYVDIITNSDTMDYMRVPINANKILAIEVDGFKVYNR